MADSSRYILYISPEYTASHAIKRLPFTIFFYEGAFEWLFESIGRVTSESYWSTDKWEKPMSFPFQPERRKRKTSFVGVPTKMSICEL